MIYRRTRLVLVGGDWRIEAQVSGLAIVPVGLGAPHDVGERQLPVLLYCGEAEVLAAEEEQGVEEDDRRVGAQLLAVPQELFLHAGINRACWEEEALARGRQHDNGALLRPLLTSNRGRGVESFQHGGELV